MKLFLIWQAWVTWWGGHILQVVQVFWQGALSAPSCILSDLLLLSLLSLAVASSSHHRFFWVCSCSHPTVCLNPFMLSSRMLHGTEKSLAHQTDEADRPGKEELLRGPPTSFFSQPSALHLRIAKQLSLWDRKASGLWLGRKFSVKVDTSMGNNPLTFTSLISTQNQLN